MRPSPRFVKLAQKQFEIGTEYPLEVHEQRSTAEHRHYFAAIREAWSNLNEDATERYPTPDHLRRWALIKAGWYRENTTVCDSFDHAMQLAAFIRKLDDFAVVIQKGNVVKIYIAKSQSYQEMSKEDFQQSSRDVLEILSGQIGISRKALENEGRA